MWPKNNTWKALFEPGQFFSTLHTLYQKWLLVFQRLYIPFSAKVSRDSGFGSGDPSPISGYSSGTAGSPAGSDISADARRYMRSNSTPTNGRTKKSKSSSKRPSKCCKDMTKACYVRVEYFTWKKVDWFPVINIQNINKLISLQHLVMLLVLFFQRVQTHLPSLTVVYVRSAILSLRCYTHFTKSSTSLSFLQLSIQILNVEWSRGLKEHCFHLKAPQ